MVAGHMNIAISTIIKMKNIQLVWTKYGTNLAIGVRYKGKDKNLIEQVYNLFYNYGVTGGSYYPMKDGNFGYFLVRPERLNKIKRVQTELGKHINNLLKTDFTREDFLQHYILGKPNLVAI